MANESASQTSAQFNIGSRLSGQHATCVWVQVFPEGDPRNQGEPGGLPGEYEVTFTLHRPGYPLQPERSISPSQDLEGDSHLRVPAAFRIAANAGAETLTVEAKPNSRGFLGSLVVRCHARDMNDAHDKCYVAVTPMLSFVGLSFDLPLAVYQVDVQEVRTGTQSYTYRNPFSEVTITAPMAVRMDPDVKTYAAIYREAITTDSMTYEFLCFFRLIESLQARRKRLAREAKKQGAAYEAPVEVYPRTRDDAAIFLNSLFPARPPWEPTTLDAILGPEAVGKGFEDIVRDYLRPIRDNIAHTLLQKAAELVTMDEPFSRRRVAAWLPVVKCIARAMLKNEFHFRFI